jgi:2,4-dienoyl-CoA reductase-like NADH-dependent reductase (Old Yellow Enzyme family)
MQPNTEPSNQSDEPLRQPLRLGSITIPNRLGRSATHENMADNQGIISQRYVDLYDHISSSGIGLIISGHMYVDRNGRTIPGMTGIDSDDCIKPLQKAVEIVHRNGSIFFAQLNHAGLKAAPEKDCTKKVVAPSKTRNAAMMTPADIDQVVEAFSQAAGRVKKAGFDGIQIHGAHTYLIAQFLSKRINHRKDKYGGSLQNRQRFLLDIIHAVRDAVGEKYPVIVKLDSYASSYASIPPLVQLISLKESLDTGKRLEEAGVNALEISCGFNATKGAYPYKAALQAHYITAGKPLQARLAGLLMTPVDLFANHRAWFEEAHNLNHIRLFKQKLDIPILAGSCFRDPKIMRTVIEQQQADMLCMCRPIIQNPLFPKQVLEGSDQISGCINCNLCLFLIPLRQPLHCYYGRTPKNIV